MNIQQESPVTVTTMIIKQKSVHIVDARDLHDFLGIEARFNDWISRRISEYEFVEGIDFYSKLSKTPKGGRPSKEYQLTLDMAKELSMVERNDKGRMARRYFIECEQQLMSAESPVQHVHPARSDERLSSSQHNDISRIIWFMTDHTRYKQSWSNAIWHALRQATNTPSPEHFHAEDVNIIASELRRIASVMITYRDAVGEYEKKLVKYVIRQRQDHQKFIDAFDKEIGAQVSESVTIPTWLDRDIVKLLTH